MSLLCTGCAFAITIYNANCSRHTSQEDRIMQVRQGRLHVASCEVRCTCSGDCGVVAKQGLGGHKIVYTIICMVCISLMRTQIQCSVVFSIIICIVPSTAKPILLCEAILYESAKLCFIFRTVLL